MVLYNKITKTKVNNEWMNELFEKLGVDKLRNKYPSALSGGNANVQQLLKRCITNQMLSLLMNQLRV